MTTVGVHEAKTRLSSLLRRVAAGEDVVITRGGEPVARLTAVEPSGPRTFGRDRGKVVVADDFDATLPRDVLDSFEG